MTILTLMGAILAFTFIPMLYAIVTAPFGYEDERGFHYATPPSDLGDAFSEMTEDCTMEKPRCDAEWVTDRKMAATMNA